MGNRRDRVRYSDPSQRIKDHNEEGRKWKPTSFRVPEGMSLFKWKKAGVYRIDLLPFIVGTGNPYAKKGTVHYERTYYVHADVGPNNDKYVCLAQTFNKKCPICEHVARLRYQGADKDTIQGFRPKERQLYLVRDRDDPEAGVQLFEASYYGKGTGFGEMLDNKLDAAGQNSPLQKFYHLHGGYVLAVKTKKDTFNKNTFFKPANIEMEPRQKNLKESILDANPCLDDLLIELSYKALRGKFDQNQEGKEEDDEEDSELDQDDDSDEEGDDEDDSEIEDEEDDDAEDDDGEGDDDDDEESDLEVGNRVTWKRKGNLKRGKIKKINARSGTALVKPADRDDPITIPLNKLKIEVAKKKRKKRKTDDDDNIPF